MHRPPTRRRRIAFALLTLVLVYGVLELAAWGALGLLEGRPFRFDRAQAQRASLYASPDAGRLDVPIPYVANKVVHPYLGFVFSPETEAVNEFGFLDAETPLRRKAPDRLIVGIVGGSVAENLARIGGEALVEQLASSPSLAGRKIELVHLAMPGYKQPQQLMTIAYLLSLGAEFDVIVNLDGFNDVALHPMENAPLGTFVAYPRMWYYYMAAMPSETMYDYLASQLRRRRSAELFSSPGLRHSVLANLIWMLRDRQLAAAQYAARRALFEVTPDSESHDAAGPRREYRNDGEMLSDLVHLWSQSSMQLARLCEANGIAYLHFLQPNQYLPGSKPLTTAEKNVAYAEDSPYRRIVEAGYPMLIAAGETLRAEGVDFHDLTAVFAAVDEPLYIDNCCHFNRQGNKIVARHVARAIADRFAVDVTP